MLLPATRLHQISQQQLEAIAMIELEQSKITELIPVSYTHLTLPTKA